MKLNDDTVKKLRDAFSLGADVSAACYSAGISRQTYYNWVNGNEKMAEEFDRLRERPVLKAYMTIYRELDKPENARWYLERKRKDEFSTKSVIDDARSSDINEALNKIGDAIGEAGKSIQDKQSTVDIVGDTTADLSGNLIEETQSGSSDSADTVRKVDDGGSSGDAEGIDL